MYIICPECDTTFVVMSKQIGQHGRKVKCSKCLHIWHQERSDLKDHLIFNSQALQATTSPLYKGMNLPALLTEKVQSYLYIMPIVLISLVLFMCTALFPNILPSSSLLNNNSLSIKDIEISKDENPKKITVDYKVHNDSNQIMKMPLVRIRLFNKTGQIIKTFIDDRTYIDISPNQFIHIKTEFLPAPDLVTKLDIMIGNTMDLILR